MLDYDQLVKSRSHHLLGTVREPNTATVPNGTTSTITNTPTHLVPASSLHSPHGNESNGNVAAAAAAAYHISNMFRKPKRIRTAFSPGQLLKLEEIFEKNRYVVGCERKQLARDLNLSETQIKVWFQNRRTKHKREKHIGPGQAGRQMTHVYQYGGYTSEEIKMYQESVRSGHTHLPPSSSPSGSEYLSNSSYSTPSVSNFHTHLKSQQNTRTLLAK